MADINPINAEHLKVYFEESYLHKDGKPYCVDVDPPDDADGTNPGGGIGYRFDSPLQAGNAVSQWLSEKATGLPTKPEVTTREEVEGALRNRLEYFNKLGYKPSAEVVVQAIAGYVIAIAGLTANGIIRFENK